MRGFLLRLGLFCAVFALINGMVLCTEPDRGFIWNDVKTDCAGRGPWMFQRMHVDTTRVDVLFLGSSYTMNAIADSSIERLLNGANKRRTHVLNLGYCRFGEVLYPELLREILPLHKPRMLVVELRVRPSQGSHPMYGALASSQGLIAPPTRLYQSFLSNLYTGLCLRWRALRMEWIGNNPEPQGSIAHFGHYGTDAIVDSGFMEGVRSRRAQQVQAQINWNDRVNMHLSFCSLQVLETMCAKHGIALRYLYFPPFGTSGRHPASPELYRAELWTIPDSIAHSPINYHDHEHMNNNGARALSKWLAPLLAEVMQSTHP